MVESLSPARVVDTLVDMDLVDLNGDGPWPGEPDDADIYEPDWTQIHPERTPESWTDRALNPWAAAVEEVRRSSKKGFLVPPPDLLDALAWYTPMHYFGLGSAIYISESAVLDVAASIFARLQPAEREEEQNVMGACRAAMSVLYLHEAFHHKVESLAIRYEIVERARRYLPYTQQVTIPLLRQGSDEVLEEALACAEMYRRFKSEALYRRGVPVAVRRATLEMLPEWFRTLPPSYREAGRYLHDLPFGGATAHLMGQVQEATSSPVRDGVEWDLAPHLLRGLFNCQRITHVLVPLGQRPFLPWVGHAPALLSISTKKAVRSLEQQGWKVESGRGKGSHVRLRQPGKPSLTIPANRESLSPVVLKSVAAALGVRLSDLAF